MSYLPHIPFKYRKVLCGRLLIIEAIQPKRLEFNNEKSLYSFERLRDDAFNIANDEIQKDLEKSNTVSMDDLLLSFSSRLKGQSSVYLEDIYGSSDLLSSFDEKISNISCHKCSKLNGIICNGGDYDDQLVGAGGQCIDSLHEMFRLAKEEAFNTYKKYSPLFQEIELNQEIGLEFSTTFVKKKPHDLPCNYYVGGSCDYKEDSHSTAIVNLFLNVEEFDWDTYLAVLYVLFHETIVHAFQGLYSLDSARYYSEADDDFAEGWMDWVSIEVMEGYLKSSSPAVKFSDDHIQEGKKFHWAKNDIESGDRSKYAIRCKYGKVTAKRLFSFIKRLGLDSPWELFLNISTDLTVLRQSTKERQKFIHALHRQLPSIDDPYSKNPNKYEKIAKAIREYDKQKNIEIFLRQCMDGVGSID